MTGQARALLESKQWEASGNALGGLDGRRFVSRRARWDAAELYFRLGEDRKAHQMLAGIPFHEGDARDREMRELSSRNLRASSLLSQAETAPDVLGRLRLIRKARNEVPESPAILARLVQEELLAITHGGETEEQGAFESDYTLLRRAAPRAAAELKRRVGELVAREAPSEAK